MTSPLEEAIRGRFGRPLRHLSEVDSTNSEALRWASSDDPAPQGALVVADGQTRGRGRWGRSWETHPGSSLAASLVLRPRWPTERWGSLTIAAGLACAEAFESLGIGPAVLKWPNDVLLDSKKVSGVLIETRIADPAPVAVVGIGVNLAGGIELPEEIAARTTDLAEAALRRGIDPPPVAAVLGAILERLEALYDELGDGSRAEPVRDRAAARMELLGAPVTLRYMDGGTSEVVATGLLPDGSLQITDEDGTRSVHAAEVERIRHR